MAQKIIPELQPTTNFDQNYLVPVDSGTQTFKITGANFAQGLKKLLGSVLNLVTTNTVLTVANAGAIIPIDSTGGSFDLELPAPLGFKGLILYVKDIGLQLSTNPVTLVRNDSEKIEGLPQDYALIANGGSWILFSDGTDWFFL